MSEYVATITISFQNGYDTSAQELVHMICTGTTTVAELIAWQETYKHCLSYSPITITSAVTKSKGGGDE